MLGIAIFLASAAPVAAPAPPAASDEEVWALARRLGSKEGYVLYVDRFSRTGAHVDEALDALRALGVRTAPPAPPAPPAPSAPPAPPAPRDPCIALIVDQETGARHTPEGRAYTAVRASNRVSGYRAFLAANAHGVCAQDAREVIEDRAGRRLRFKDMPGFGPLAAQRMAPRVIDEWSYPPLALRKEQQGIVRAEWSVAEDGIVEDCRIVRSSGHAELDTGTCLFVTLRYRYDPARDSAGRPVRTTDRSTFRWALPADPPSPPPAPHP